MKKTLLLFFYALFLSLAIYLPAQIAQAQDEGLTFVFGQQAFNVSPETLISWRGEQNVGASQVLPAPTLSFKVSLSNFLGRPPAPTPSVLVYHHRLDKIYSFLTDVSGQLDVASEEPALEIKDYRAVKFSPPQTGLKLDVYQTALASLRALELNRKTIDLTVYLTAPKGELAQTNSLGINQLIAEGVSNFKGSPNNRRHNIDIGIEKFKGLIVPQGAEFSFDDNLGPVTAEAGFLPELVIKGSEGTIPELGGGLCQVSTTTFRAAMAAGLPITARRNHAYAVQYYSPQGTDATIYPGSADLKFINDTPGAILIWPYEKDKNTLVYDFYGTKDGRQVTLQTPVVYDRKPDGSMKATWTRLVTLDGNTRTDVFKSTYQSPALFHKTQSFVPAASPVVPVLAPPVNQVQ